MVMATPSPQQVGREFVRQYYTVLHEAPELLHRFYSSGSMFVHGGVDRPGHQEEEPVIGQKEIDKKIRLLNFKDCHTKIRQVDAQSTIGNGVVVQVTGELSNNGEAMRRFMQTFVLAPQTPKKFYVHNDIFRYQDEVYQDLSDTESDDQPQQQQSEIESVPPQQQQQQQQQEEQQEQEQEQVEEQSVVSQEVNQVESEVMGQSSEMNGNLHSSSSSASSEVNVQEKEEERQATQQPVQEQEVTLVEEAKPEPEVVQKPVEQVVESVSTTSTSVSAPIATKTNSWAKIISNKTETSNPVSAQQTPAPAVVQVPRQQVQQQHQPVAKEAKPYKQMNGSSKPNKPRLNTQNEKPRQPAPVQQQQQQQQQQQHQQQQQQQQPAPTQQSAAQQQVNGNAEIDDIEKRFGRYPDGQQVFVGNLSQEISENDLKQFFGIYGKVLEVRINTNTKQQSGRRLPNYGFVVFEEKSVVDQLLGSSKSNNLTYKNDKGVEYRLNVEEKRARQGRPSAGNYNGGTNKQRATRSTSNGSRGATNKKNYSQSNNDFSEQNRRKEVNESGEAGSRKSNYRRS